MNSNDYSGQFLPFLVAAVVAVVVAVVTPKKATAPKNTSSQTNKKNSNSSAPPVVGMSKGNSFKKSTGYQQPSAREIDAHHKSKAGKNPNKSDLKSFNAKQKHNQKVQGARNKAKDSRSKDDNDKNNPTAPPNIPPNPYLSSGGDGSINVSPSVVAGAGVTAAGIIGIWFYMKIYSPACGPFAPICVVVL